MSAVAPRVENKTDYAYASIREKILDGSYGPGFRLVIDALARDLNVSAVPVREAIRRLEAEEWVRFTPNVGATVTEIDATRWVDGLEVLAVLDGFATARAARELTGDDLDEMQAINKAMRDAASEMDLFGFRASNREFHSVIIRRCPNAELRGEIYETWDRIERMRRSLAHYISARAPESVREHEQLIELIAGRAPLTRIESFARRHQLHTLDSYLKNSGHERNGSPSG